LEHENQKSKKWLHDLQHLSPTWPFRRLDRPALLFDCSVVVLFSHPSAFAWRIQINAARRRFPGCVRFASGTLHRGPIELHLDAHHYRELQMSD
jgi:hypothetical protein